VIPLYGFLQGDTIGLLILAEEQDTAGELANKLQAAAQVRVKPRPAMDVVYNGEVLHPRMTVGEVRMEPLDRFDVVEAGPS